MDDTISLNKIYTGIGARKTPSNILTAMTNMGRFMASKGFILRSGGANGADSAFEEGCDDKEGEKEIYLPWKGFNRNLSPLYGSTRQARTIAKEFHPKWPVLGDTARDFMGRNSHQILGRDLKTPTRFVICWTPNGQNVGGTAQAIRVANHYNIPILNFGLFSFDDLEKQIMKLIKP